MVAGPAAGQQYKIRLESGRILGPIGIDRVRLLIQKNRITGAELARLHPEGDWQAIQQIPEIAELLLAKIEGKLGSDGAKAAGASSRSSSSNASDPAKTEILSTLAGDGATVRLDSQKPQPAPGSPARPSSSSDASAEPPLEKTVVAEIDPGDKTRVVTGGIVPTVRGQAEVTTMVEKERRRQIAQEQTIVLSQPLPPRREDTNTAIKQRKLGPKELLKIVVAAVLLGTVWYELFLEEPSEHQKPIAKYEPIRARMPAASTSAPDPELSMRIYREGMLSYVADTVAAYKVAVEKFRQAAAADPGNVKAHAMLASSYLNLIDSSNKDENYFAVISNLIERSRAKELDLPEAVIADVEFFITVNKPEAAQNRIVEYTKLHQKFEPSMFYYLALAFYHRGDANSAVRFLTQIPDDQVFSPKVYYLGGLIAEKLQDAEEAIKVYKKAIKRNPDHLRSRLRIADILYKRGMLKEAKPEIEYIVVRNHLLAPKELAYAYYLAALLYETENKWETALAYMERGVKLEKENHDYLLELYTLRGKTGESAKSLRKDAQMYAFLGEGEKLVRLGKYQEALVQFLKARESNDKSPLPLVKSGDMFMYLNDLGNARANYKLAAEKSPTNIDIWSKYIKVLIDSFEWEEAQQAMNKFRNLPVNQSAIDRAAADMYQKQGRLAEAQAYYRKAMARDSIDSEVYIAYARSLMSSRNFDDAPFFFAVALRSDPLNADALIGIAKCTAEKSGIDSAVTMLQDELQKDSGNRAQLLAAIAELQMQKGAWELAQANIEQALATNPQYAYPYKLQAQLYLSNESKGKDMLDLALASYKSYSDRNPSDPSGYLERYKIFVRKTDFDKAAQELDKIYAIHPRYPRLHYFKGLLYTYQDNHKAAADEFRAELQTSPKDAPAKVMLAQALIKLNDLKGAMQNLTLAMEEAPSLADAKHWAGYTNYLMKNFSGAVALYKAALQLDSGNPLIYKRLGLAYRDMGDFVGARQAFNKYLELAPDAPDRAEFQNNR